MSSVTAVLIDTVSIQKYVYSGNRLKENIGASKIVTDIYKEGLKSSLETILQHKVNLNKWEEKPEEVSIEDSNIDFEVGYIGGGNALLLFKDQAVVKELIKEWTRNLLLEAPSLNTAFAVSKFDLDNFQKEMKDLHIKLEMNKSKYFSQTFLPKHGITADCRYSGLSCENYYHPSEEEKGNYISSASYVKNTVLDVDDVKQEVEQASKGRFTCTTNIDSVGQTKGQNHIAIIYIDGNSMGEYFKSSKSLIQTRKLSKRLKDIMESVNKEFISYVIDQMGFFLSKDSGFEIKQENGTYIIPFRPILREGDDITFITDGRLGIPFAEKYLKLMSEKMLLKDRRISACAGVAIIKTKYPFFRGYKLAEELCQSSKVKARKEKDTSWLDFHVAYGGFSGTLSEIRKRKYHTKAGQLHFGPYLVASEDLSNEKDIQHLKNGICAFMEQEEWPRSKVKEFRECLTLGEIASEYFREEAKLKGRKLYDLKETGKGYSTNIWQNGFTPYFDMIELLDMYPKYFLNKGQVNSVE